VVTEAGAPPVLERIPKIAELVAHGDDDGLLRLLDEILPDFHLARTGAPGTLAA
jgi:hypothetical protein